MFLLIKPIIYSIIFITADEILMLPTTNLTSLKRAHSLHRYNMSFMCKGQFDIKDSLSSKFNTLLKMFCIFGV